MSLNECVNIKPTLPQLIWTIYCSNSKQPNESWCIRSEMMQLFLYMNTVQCVSGWNYWYCLFSEITLPRKFNFKQDRNSSSVSLSHARVNVQLDVALGFAPTGSAFQERSHETAVFGQMWSKCRSVCKWYHFFMLDEMEVLALSSDCPLI